VAATGGAGGVTGPGTSNGGTAGTIFTSTNGILSSLGIVDSIAGQNGSAGQNNVAGSNISIINITTGGAGGGGTTSSLSSFSGGTVTGIGFVPTVLGGSASGTNAGSGGAGFISLTPSSLTSVRQPFLTTGGAGGGATNSTSGTNSAGSGGNGGYGSGGGGGGAAYTGTGGTGGRGGDGIVIITCW
jgi:hypothetical protein